MDDVLADWMVARPGWRRAVEQVLRERDFDARPDESGVPREFLAQRLRQVAARLLDARDAWSEETFPTDPGDARVAELWAQWGAGDPWSGQAEWNDLLLRPVVRSFRMALASRSIPGHVVERALGDVRDAMYYQLVGGGFAELAAYVLETAPGGPVEPLYEMLSPEGRERVAGCVTRRGHWARTLEAALPAAGPDERALLLRHEPATPSEWIDLHVLMRLIDAWSVEAGDPERDWAIVSQNQGRARGRLRAVVLLEPPARIAEPVTRLAGLAARTRAAGRRWAWSWAWEEVARGFSMSIDQPVVRACRAGPGPAPLDGSSLACVEGWLLLAILRGRGPTVQRWCVDGTGDTDGSWGRLLQILPDPARDADGGYTRVRAALALRGPEMFRALRPTLQEIARLEPGRDLKARFWSVAGAVWHDSVPKPRGGFPTSVRNAQAWLAAEHGSETASGMPWGEEA